MSIKDPFSEAAPFLFGQLAEDEDGERLVVCVEHSKFIPCRPCFRTPASTPYSNDPEVVRQVRASHHDGPTQPSPPA